MIYEYALYHCDYGNVIQPCAPLPSRRSKGYKRLVHRDNLLFVNHQLQFECLPFYYSSNTFELLDFHQVKFFLRTISSRCHPWITALRISAQGPESVRDATSLISGLPKLETLYLRFDYSAFRILHLQLRHGARLVQERCFCVAVPSWEEIVRNLFRLRNIKNVVVEQYRNCELPELSYAYDYLERHAPSNEEIQQRLREFMSLPVGTGGPLLHWDSNSRFMYWWNALADVRNALVWGKTESHQVIEGDYFWARPWDSLLFRRQITSLVQFRKFRVFSLEYY